MYIAKRSSDGGDDGMKERIFSGQPELTV